MPGMHVRRALPALVLFLVLGGASHAAADRDPAGNWRGSIRGVLRLGLHIERSPDGRLRGTLDRTDQGVMGMKLDSLVATGDSLRFTLRAARGRYAARLSAGGDSLVGVWRQGGMAAALVFTRGEHAPLRRPQEPRPPYPYDTLLVTFENPRAAGVRLAGTLTLPRGGGPFPAVLLISGSGQQDRDETLVGHRPFKVLADHLTRGGIAVLRVDDRGAGGSTGSFETATSEDFAGDALAGVEFLTKRPGISRRAIGLIGHSEGGMIAPLVATRSNDVAFIVLLAAPGIPGDSLMMLQMAAARRPLGVTEDQLAREAVLGRRASAAALAGDSAGVARALRELTVAQLSTLPRSQREAEGSPDEVTAVALRHLLSPWARHFLTYDPASVLRRVRCPVLALNGGRDVQVPPRENLAGIEAALRAGGNRDATTRELPGLNHLFQTCTTCTKGEYAQLEETFAPSALEIVSEWIRERTGLAR